MTAYLIFTSNSGGYFIFKKTARSITRIRITSLGINSSIFLDIPAEKIITPVKDKFEIIETLHLLYDLPKILPRKGLRNSLINLFRLQYFEDNNLVLL